MSTSCEDYPDCLDCPINGDNKELSSEVINKLGMCITYSEEEVSILNDINNHKGVHCD